MNENNESKAGRFDAQRFVESLKFKIPVRFFVVFSNIFVVAWITGYGKWWYLASAIYVAYTTTATSKLTVGPKYYPFEIGFLLICTAWIGEIGFGNWPLIYFIISASIYWITCWVLKKWGRTYIEFKFTK